MIAQKYPKYIVIVAIVILTACISPAQNNSREESGNGVYKELEVKSLNELETILREEIQSIDRAAYCLEEIDPKAQFKVYRSSNRIQLTMYQCLDKSCEYIFSKSYEKFIEIRWINDSYELFEEIDTYFFKQANTEVVQPSKKVSLSAIHLGGLLPILSINTHLAILTHFTQKLPAIW